MVYIIHGKLSKYTHVMYNIISIDIIYTGFSNCLEMHCEVQAKFAMYNTKRVILQWFSRSPSDKQLDIQ